MKILIDMNLAPRWVEVLENSGISAVHWSTLGPGEAPDETIFRYARENAFVVFTHDLDFGTMLAYTRASGPSVLQVRAANTSPEGIAHLVLAALREHEEALAAGALVTVDSVKCRVRVLPIGG